MTGDGRKSRRIGRIDAGHVTVRLRMHSASKVDQRTVWLAAARKAMETEADAVRAASVRLDQNLIRAVELILGHSGKLVVIGLGKSGHVARKIAATLQST